MITITVVRELDDSWGLPELLNNLDDQELISLVFEDPADFLNGASWIVDRSA